MELTRCGVAFEPKPNTFDARYRLGVAWVEERARLRTWVLAGLERFQLVPDLIVGPFGTVADALATGRPSRR